MFELFSKFKKYTDYLPLILVALFFISENEVEKHALNTSCQISMTIITVAIFYIMVIRYKNTKLVALLATGLIWACMVYIKKKYVENTI